MESELVTDALKIIKEDTEFFKGIDPRIKNLFEQAQTDGTVSRFNIRDKALLISTYRTKWFMIWTKEKTQLNRLKDERDSWIEQAIKTAAAGGTSLPKIALKTKIEESQEVVAYNKKIEAQEEVVSFLVGIRAIFDDFSFTVNNSLNALQQENS